MRRKRRIGYGFDESRLKRFDWGDMYTKPQSNGGIDTSPLTNMKVGTPAGLQQGASPYYTPSNLNTIAQPPKPKVSDETKGNLIGTAGQLIGSAIESKTKLQDTDYTRDLQDSRKEARTALYGIGTAAAAVNPIVGGAIIAGTAIGSAIGSQTQDEFGMYKSRSGNALDEMVNPVTGYQGIKRAFKGQQTQKGVLNKLTLGLAGKSDNQREAEEGKREFEEKRMRAIRERSRQTLANYPISGKTNYNTMLAFGGKFKKKFDIGGITGKPEPKADPYEEYEEGTPGQAASPYYSSENLNKLVTIPEKPRPQTNQPPPAKQSWFNSPRGQATGAIVNAAASYIPQNEKFKKVQTEGERSTDEMGTQIASAIGPWWGALAKVGTTASGYIRQDDDVKHARGFLGDTVNPFHQFNSLSEGKGEEKTAAFLNPVAASHMAAKRRKQIAVNKKKEEIASIQRAGQARLGQYNTAGDQFYAAHGLQFPMGGDLPTPTEHGSGEQLASNMAQYHGPKHSGGGIELDTDQDAKADIEVEGKEVIKDNMVFSNRLRPSKDAKNAARQAGVSIKKGDTYATLSARIGKKKGNYEQQLNSTRPGEKNTAQLMQGRLDEVADSLFIDQQVRKFKKDSGKKRPYGGSLPKYTTTKQDATRIDIRRLPPTPKKNTRKSRFENLLQTEWIQNMLSYRYGGYL